MAEPLKTPTRAAEGDDRAFTCLLVFTLALFLRPQDLFPPLEALHLAELSALAGLVFLFTGRLARREPLTRITVEFVAVLALGAVILITAPFSLWFGGSVRVFTEMYSKVILVYLLAVNAISSPRRLERLSWALVLSVGFVALLAVADYARGVNMTGRGTRVRGAVGGIMQNPNDLALNMVVFLPIAAAFALTGPVWRRLMAAGCALGMVGAIIASGSRGGFLGFVVMLAVLGVFLVRTRPMVVIAGVLAVMCALPVLPANYWRRIASITDSSKDDFGSADARRTLIRESWQAYLENPIVGVGAGEFKDWNNDRRIESWHEAHNVWLQIAAELGTLGFLAYLFLVARGPIAVYQTRRMLRRAKGGGRGAPPATDLTAEELARLDAHSAAMAASIAGWLVCAFFASVAYNWTFYYLLALAATPRDIIGARLRYPVGAARAAAAARAARRRLVLAGGREARA